MMEVLFVLGSYLVGSIPFGYLVGIAYGVNVLAEGSGSTGATNVGRLFGKKASAVVLLFDVLKGALPAVVVQILMDGSVWGQFSVKEFGLLCSCLAVVGHIASPFLRFKGGKGVATALGMLIGSAWMVGTIVLGSFILSMLLTRIVSLSSMVGALAMVTAGVFLTKSPWFIVVYSLVALTVIYRHRSNIGRLLKGEEKKFSFGGGSKSEPEGGASGDT